MEKKQTAVGWLISQLALVDNSPFQAIAFYYDNKDLIEKAKEIEKEQIIDARVSGFASSAEGWNGEIPCMKWSEMVRETKCVEYYNETYLK
ncbi:MAG: hypothetical protein RI965_1778 [Bacteroidota bacterium]|jgi:hypothetical protein